jgi:hypothetical protein
MVYEIARMILSKQLTLRINAQSLFIIKIYALICEYWKEQYQVLFAAVPSLIRVTVIVEAPFEDVI